LLLNLAVFLCAGRCG